MLFASPVPQTAGGLAPFNRRALQFSAAASKRLTLTFGSSPTDLTRQTFSAFVFMTAYPASPRSLFSQYTGPSAYGLWDVYSDGSIVFQQDNDGLTVKGGFRTHANAVPLNQPVHLHIAYDSTLATPADRLVVSINCTVVTSFASFAPPALNYAAEWYGTARLHEIGTYASGQYWDDRLDEFAFVDGAALPASTFATADIRARDLAGIAWGNNGLWLRFEDTANFGLDSSGRGNHATPQNLSAGDSIVAFA